MNYKLSKTLMWGIWLVALGFLAAAALTDTDWPGITGIVLFFVGLLQAELFYRCPHCGYGLLSRGGGAPKFCPNCGERLEED